MTLWLVPTSCGQQGAGQQPEEPVVPRRVAGVAGVGVAYPRYGHHHKRRQGGDNEHPQPCGVVLHPHRNHLQGGGKSINTKIPKQQL